MHQAAYETMSQILTRIGGQAAGPLKVLDIGSLDVNGSYRPIVTGLGWEYIGLDIRPGNNVDILAKEPYAYPLYNGTFDVVISGSTLEHVEKPWVWIYEAARLVKPGGRLVVYTHWRYHEHRYPKDYWRFMKDGIKTLFDLTGSLEAYEIRYVNAEDIVGIARKRAADNPREAGKD